MKINGRRISLRRCIVPLGFVFCCTFYVGVCSAKMLNRGDISHNDTVSIAGWSVEVSATDSSLTLDAGSNAQAYALEVTNNSDVISTYSIKVSNIPNGVKLGLDTSSDDDLVTPVGGEVVFSNTGGDLNFTAPNNTRTHNLMLKADALANVTENSVDMSIDVVFTQKDPRL